MKVFHRTRMATILIGLAFAVAPVFNSCRKEGGSQHGVLGPHNVNGAGSDGEGVHAGPGALPGASKAQSSQSATWLSRWDEVQVTEKGNLRAPARKVVAQEALETLSGPEMGEFIAGINERRDPETVDWLIENGVKALFGDKVGQETREWLAQVGDPALRDRLYFQAGYYFSGPGFKEYLTSLTLSSAQDRVLTGYCCGFAESEAVRAMDEFANLRPKDVSFQGLTEVVLRFPEDADFTKIGLRYGDDFTASNSLAKAVRGQLLRRWANFHPEQAGRFVMDNPKLVAVDQLEKVVMPWLSNTPEVAEQWVAELPAGVYRDQGVETLAKYWLTTNPAKAWPYAAQVGAAEKRVAVATAVFKEWEQADREAAVKAWTELFPGE